MEQPLVKINMGGCLETSANRPFLSHLAIVELKQVLHNNQAPHAFIQNRVKSSFLHGDLHGNLQLFTSW